MAELAPLDGSCAVVTGGGRGIGRAIAARLTDHGARVLVCDLDPATGPDVVCDVTDSAAVAGLYRHADERFGRLDILVNNVGVAGPTAAVDATDPAAFDECLTANLGSALRCAQLAVPRLRAAGGGAIVNIVSTAGTMGYPLRSAYAASKWGLVGLTKTWAMELGPDGIRVNAVCPGSVDGPRMDAVIEREAAAVGSTPDEIRAAYADQVSMQTLIEPADIGEAVAWLCSPSARFVSGQVLAVDGNTETLRTRRVVR